MNTKKLLTVISLIIFTACSAQAGSPCDDARKAGKDKVAALYSPLLDEYAKVIANMTKKGIDPHKFYDAVHDQVIDLVALSADLIAQRDKQLKEVDDKVTSDCDGTVGFLQTITDVVVARYTLGLSLILPKHMTHVDVGEILKGKPLGGDNAVVPQVRDAIFDSMGMGKTNDIRIFTSDPINTTKDSANKVLEDWGVPVRF